MTAPAAPAATSVASTAHHLGVLDGWRAFSILAVLAGHWLPLGPRQWGLNGAAAASGMAVFFTLSGFLIVRALLADPHVPSFLVRRAARILPLAWLAMLVIAALGWSDWRSLAYNLAFVANLPPDHLTQGGHHLWSLCVEAQFYLAIALVVAVGGRRGLALVPVGAAAVTLARILASEPISIVTWHRVDEILAGGTLALIACRGRGLERIGRVPNGSAPVLLALLFLSASPAGGVLAYARPYLAAAAVGASLIALPRAMRRLWCSPPARYVAEVSYALYVIHGVLGEGWLGSGPVVVKYAKRPLLIALTFALAHLSTRYYERPATAWGKHIVRRMRSAAARP